MTSYSKPFAAFLLSFIMILKPFTASSYTSDTEVFLLSQENAPKIMGEKYIVKDPQEIAPKERAKVFPKLEQVSRNARIFAKLFKKANPDCVFPMNGYYTIFIPYNDAVTQQMLEKLDQLKPEPLCLFLSHFIVPEEVPLPEKFRKKTYITLSGTEVPITQDPKDKTVYYAGYAEIVMPFALTDHGVTVHIINKVNYIDAIKGKLQVNEELIIEDQN